MKTYTKNGFRFFYDTHIKFWTVLKIDKDGNQIGTAEYFPNKENLFINYPYFKYSVNAK